MLEERGKKEEETLITTAKIARTSAAACDISGRAALGNPCKFSIPSCEYAVHPEEEGGKAGANEA